MPEQNFPNEALPPQKGGLGVSVSVPSSTLAWLRLVAPASVIYYSLSTNRVLVWGRCEARSSRNRHIYHEQKEKNDSSNNVKNM